ncbi:MAG: hypothetical protein JEZ06_06330 [Anaerolineaceae bacterium]|nr:hypothetical protein [Anaerolineaceae bacterium]
MLFERKTKDRSIIHYIWQPIGAMLIFLITASTAGFGPAFYVMGSIYLIGSIFPLLIFWKTRNTGYLAVASFQIFATLVCFSTPPAIKDKQEAGLIPLFIVGMYISLMVVLYLSFNRKLRWRGQEVFELAAMSVEDIGDSYTDRPRPAGKIKFSKTEMIRFVDFMTVNLVAFVFNEEQRMIFVLTLPGNDLPYLLGIKKDYLEDTWISVDQEGNVSVNITQEDYLIFKKDLDFDQLCQSLGNVFIEFMELCRNGKESQIIDQMNALRLNPFS